jgi:hypothetical protein
MLPLVLARAVRGQGFERWDGTGQPTRARGEAIALPMRLAAVALDAHRGYVLNGNEGVVHSPPQLRRRPLVA